MTLFDSANTFAQFWRFLHIVVGITWIGLLYYFNFVQVPAFAAFKEASARNEAIDKLARKALWYFRWAAVATFVTGLLIALTTEDYFKEGGQLVPSGSSFGKAMGGLSISTGMLLGTIMMLNVWGVIWRNQKIVLANAANVLAGGQADPNAAAAGRKALMASRQNAMFSVTMIWFMTITSHLSGAFGDGGATTSGKMGAYWLIALAVIGLLELSALGIIGGTTAGNITNWFYESVQNVLIGAFGLWAFFWLLWEILF